MVPHSKSGPGKLRWFHLSLRNVRIDAVFRLLEHHRQNKVRCPIRYVMLCPRKYHLQNENGHSNQPNFLTECRMPETPIAIDVSEHCANVSRSNHTSYVWASFPGIQSLMVAVLNSRSRIVGSAMETRRDGDCAGCDPALNPLYDIFQF